MSQPGVDEMLCTVMLLAKKLVTALWPLHGHTAIHDESRKKHCIYLMNKPALFPSDCYYSKGSVSRFTS